MYQNKAFIYPRFTGDGKVAQLDATPHNSEISEWCSVLFPIVTGLPALYCCLALGGVFAYMGPLAIFIAARILSKRLERGWSIHIPTFKPALLAKRVADFNGGQVAVSVVHMVSFARGRSEA
jgi:hypothetical protein